MARVTIYNSVVRAESLAIARRVVDDVMYEVETQAKILTLLGPYSNGYLSRSIRRRPLIVRGDVVTGDVFSPLDYAKSVHDGAKPHLIKPRGPGYPLRFFWRKVGHVVTPWVVHHPGQKGQHFLTKPLAAISARHGWVVYTRDT
jgi:hypothetical protein